MVGKPAPLGAGDGMRAALRGVGVVTVCEEARCPNLSDCFERGVATFMILGDTCTRTCSFCSVAQGTPHEPEAGEPGRVAAAARELGLGHVVITSVNRDDLDDGGAGQFVATIEALREAVPEATVEVLTPDFGGRRDGARRIVDAGPQVFNHNLETVPRLYGAVRPGADYGRSLGLLAAAKSWRPEVVTKSGVMVGLGETDDELLILFRDLAATGCDVLTIGQYLRPTARQRPVSRYLTPAAFAHLKGLALEVGFKYVAAGARVRSSFNAGTLLGALRS